MKGLFTKGAACALVIIGLRASPAFAAARPIDLTDRTHGGFGRTMGTISWSLTPFPPGSYEINLEGALTAAGRGSTLWLSWNALGVHYNKPVKSAPPGHVLHYKRHFKFEGGPSNITLTLCSSTQGKGCGSHQKF